MRFKKTAVVVGGRFFRCPLFHYLRCKHRGGGEGGDAAATAANNPGKKGKERRPLLFVRMEPIGGQEAMSGGGGTPRFRDWAVGGKEDSLGAKQLWRCGERLCSCRLCRNKPLGGGHAMEPGCWRGGKVFPPASSISRKERTLWGRSFYGDAVCRHKRVLARPRRRYWGASFYGGGERGGERRGGFRFLDPLGAKQLWRRLFSRLSFSHFLFLSSRNT